MAVYFIFDGIKYEVPGGPDAIADALNNAEAEGQWAKDGQTGTLPVVGGTLYFHFTDSTPYAVLVDGDEQVN